MAEHHEKEDRDFDRQLAGLAHMHGQRRVTKRVPSKMGDVVNDLIARRGYLQSATAAALRAAWAEVAGDKFAASSQVGTVRRGVLNIFVKNSVVLQELSFRKSDLLKRLQAAPSGDKIKDLRFRVG